MPSVPAPADPGRDEDPAWPDRDPMTAGEREAWLAGLGPVDPWLARNLVRAAAANPATTWCVTVTDQHGHATGHGCARPEPKRHRKRAGPGARDGPGFGFAPDAGQGTWRLRVPGSGPDLLVSFDPVTAQDCDHRFQARGHDPGSRLRHLTQVRHATCTGPWCRRPAEQCDFEHNTPYEAGGRTCLCNGGPQYLSIGFTFDHGELRLGPGQTAAAPPPKPRWFERPLGSAGFDQFVIDLRQPAPAPVRRWLDAPVVTRGLPEGGPDAHMAGGTLAQWFDLIVHRQTVTPA